MDAPTRQEVMQAYDAKRTAFETLTNIEIALKKFHREALKHIGPKKFDMIGGIYGYVKRLPDKASVFSGLQDMHSQALRDEETTRRDYTRKFIRCKDAPKPGPMRVELVRFYDGAYRSTMDGKKYIEVRAEFECYVARLYNISVERAHDGGAFEIVYAFLDHPADADLLRNFHPPKSKFIDFCLLRGVNPMVYDATITYTDYREGLQRKENRTQTLLKIGRFKASDSLLKLDEKPLNYSLFRAEKQADFYNVGDIILTRGRTWRITHKSEVGLKLHPVNRNNFTDEVEEYISYVMPSLEEIEVIRRANKPNERHVNT